MTISSMPLATASSTIYDKAGVSTIGKSSFGKTFVTGKNLVPKPAQGMIAFFTDIRVSPYGRFFIPYATKTSLIL